MSDISGSLFMTANAAGEALNKFTDRTRPMKVVESHIADALNHHGYSVDITVSTDFSFDTDDYDSDGKDLTDIRESWGEDWLNNHPDASPHFNQLFMRDGEWPNPAGNGGIATIPRSSNDSLPRRGVLLNMVKAGYHSLEADRYGPQSDAVEGKIRRGVHETGHNLNMVHANGLRYEDDEFGQQVIRASPMGCSSGDDWVSNCGENCTRKNTEQWDHYYTKCEKDAIRL